MTELDLRIQKGKAILHNNDSVSKITAIFGSYDADSVALIQISNYFRATATFALLIYFLFGYITFSQHNNIQLLKFIRCLGDAFREPSEFV